MTTSSTTTSTTTSIIDKKTEKKYPPTTTTTTSTTTTSTTTSPTTTEERTTAIDVPTPTQLEPTIPDIEVKVVTTTQESTPAPSPKSQSSSKESWEGDATYYDPGVGSCGNTNGPGDMIAAISYLVMDPLNPGNPNNNPICGKQIRCTRDGLKETIITVVDRCPVCKAGDLDLSPAAYAALGGTIAEGRFKIQCSWV
ncbi:RlpA-like double-psi beta-barrel-protein domain-containing protein-containing protein [Tirmania nivea]|nr:RlpA-like double-psi beta-barrel-protein domain-containing protein-containing protein [Tirmania nivea]